MHPVDGGELLGERVGRGVVVGERLGDALEGASASVSQMPSRVSQSPDGGPYQLVFMPMSSASVPRIAGVHSMVWILAISAETISRAVW